MLTHKEGVLSKKNEKHLFYNHRIKPNYSFFTKKVNGFN